MGKLILARHGETEWNVGEVFRGRYDIELNEAGKRQAQLLARHLRQAKIEAVHSSPLKRALETAGAIAAEHQLEVATEEDLIDFDYGRWQGKTRQEVQGQYPELYRRWREAPHQVTTPGGESLEEVRQRATRVIKTVTAQDNTVVLVSHRVVNKVLLCALLGLDNSHFWNLRLDNCGTSTFSYEKDRFILEEHNNTSYLEPMNNDRLADF